MDAWFGLELDSRFGVIAPRPLRDVPPAGAPLVGTTMKTTTVNTATAKACHARQLVTRCSRRGGTSRAAVGGASLQKLLPSLLMSKHC